ENGARAAAAVRNDRCRRSALRLFPGVPVRARLLELVDGVGNVDPFARAVIGDRVGKRRIADRVQRMRGDGQQSPRQLVRTLCAALEARYTALDAEVDGLVIAGFEMEAGHVVERAPVAAPQRLVRVYVERRAERRAVACAH